MKAYKIAPSMSKLINRFDDELLNILLEDLRNFKLKNQFLKTTRRLPRHKQARLPDHHIYPTSVYLKYYTSMKTIKPCQKQGFIFLKHI